MTQDNVDNVKKEIEKNYLFEEDRFRSFKSWPFKKGSPCSIEKMAEAGFYWCGNERENDTAACFACGKVLDGWESNDDPWIEHKKHAPQCSFVQMGKCEKELTVAEYITLLGICGENKLLKAHKESKKKIQAYFEKKRDEYIKMNR